MSPTLFFTHPLIIALLSALALRITGWLWWKSRGAGSLPGCGPGTPCKSVLKSRWSRVGSIPVSLLGSMLYAATIVASIAVYLGESTKIQHPARLALTALFPMIGGGTIWFIVLQRFILHRICKWCVISNLIGLFISVCVYKYVAAYGFNPGPLVFGFSSVVGLIVLQILIKPVGYQGGQPI